MSSSRDKELKRDCVTRGPTWDFSLIWKIFRPVFVVLKIYAHNHCKRIDFCPVQFSKKLEIFVTQLNGIEGLRLCIIF